MPLARVAAVAASALAVAATALVVASLGGAPSGAVTAPMPPPAPVAAVPGSVGVPAAARLLDTRVGNGAPRGAVGPNGAVTFTVTARGGVPAQNVSSVLLTVTAIAPSSSGTIAVRAHGATAATTVITFVPGVTAANLVLARVGTGGQVDLINSSLGSVQLVADLAAYNMAGTPQAAGAVQPVAPARLLDTRFGNGAAKAAVRPGATVQLQVTGRGGAPASVGAVFLNVTAVSPTASGTIAVWPAGTSKPGVSQVNFAAGRTMGDLVLAQVGSGGAVELTNNSPGTVQLVADMFGYVLPGTAGEAGVVATVAGSRLLDTRSGLGAPKAAVGGGRVVTLQVAARGGLPATNVGSVALTVTAVSPTAAGTVIAWGDGQAQPTVASLNHAAGQNVSTLVVVPVGPDGKVSLANSSAGSVQLVADLAGYVRADPHTLATTTSRYVRNLTGGASDASVMNSEGCADAQQNADGAQHLMLLDIGGQNMINGGYGVQLTAVSQTLSDLQVVAAVNGYVDGYASCATGGGPALVAVATNNDGSLRDSAAGQDWADNVIEPVVAHASGDAGVTIAGANDIEPDFTGLESEAEAWTRGFLAATSAPYVFVGAASGCLSTQVGGTCAHSWTQRNFYDLAHGLAPTRILALPQVYYATNAAQWRYISQAGASGADRIDFVGTLSEYAACQTPGSGCDMSGLLTAAQSWQALRTQVSSNAAINLQRLPVSTDLRIDTAPGAPVSASRVTTAGVH